MLIITEVRNKMVFAGGAAAGGIAAACKKEGESQKGSRWVYLLMAIVSLVVVFSIVILSNQNR
jgi:predicted membrane channel-forming protein YqfA (hemolysin III family)